ncbi:MAG: hypothetical protein JHC93_07665 [Parachlamydiales bacterium]|nr:hypothetical protein [Parachlamydiales bacterium]
MSISLEGSIRDLSKINAPILWRLSEGYLDREDKGYKVAELNGSQIRLEKDSRPKNYVVTLLKIVSYALCLPVLVAKSIRSHYRKQYSYTIYKSSNVAQNSSQKISDPLVQKATDLQQKKNDNLSALNQHFSENRQVLSDIERRLETEHSIYKNGVVFNGKGEKLDALKFLKIKTDVLSLRNKTFHLVFILTGSGDNFAELEKGCSDFFKEYQSLYEKGFTNEKSINVSSLSLATQEFVKTQQKAASDFNKLLLDAGKEFIKDFLINVYPDENNPPQQFKDNNLTNGLKTLKKEWQEALANINNGLAGLKRFENLSWIDSDEDSKELVKANLFVFSSFSYPEELGKKYLSRLENMRNRYLKNNSIVPNSSLSLDPINPNKLKLLKEFNKIAEKYVTERLVKVYPDLNNPPEAFTKSNLKPSIAALKEMWEEKVSQPLAQAV